MMLALTMADLNRTWPLTPTTPRCCEQTKEQYIIDKQLMVASLQQAVIRRSLRKAGGLLSKSNRYGTCYEVIVIEGGSWGMGKDFRTLFLFVYDFYATRYHGLKVFWVKGMKYLGIYLTYSEWCLYWPSLEGEYTLWKYTHSYRQLIEYIRGSDGDGCMALYAAVCHTNASRYLGYRDSGPLIVVTLLHWPLWKVMK